MERHSWMRPSVVSIGGVWTARQTCYRCEAERNPISGEMLDRGDGLCRDRDFQNEPDQSGWVARVRSELEWMARSGLTVDLYLGRPQEETGEVIDTHPAAAGSGF